jgi:hypothetical protein
MRTDGVVLLRVLIACANMLDVWVMSVLPLSQPIGSRAYVISLSLGTLFRPLVPEI